MPHRIVTCRCTRTMRQEPGRPAGYLVCGCGNRVKLNGLGDFCEVLEDGELCPRTPVLTEPITLCARHVSALASTPAFGKSTPANNMVIAREHVQMVQREGNARKRERDRREWEFQEELRQKELRAQSQVYYVGLRNCIKIGYTTNMKARMGQLMPDAILATEPGGREVEKQRHQQFRALKAAIGSEYFAPAAELMAHIESILAKHGPPKITGYPDYDTWHLGDRMLVPVKDAAHLAGVGLRTVYDWIREGRITATIPAGKKRGTLVNVKEVDQLVELQQAGRLPRLDHVRLPH